MSRHSQVMNAALLVLLFALLTAAGCQQSSAPASKQAAPAPQAEGTPPNEEAAATGELVTVDVPGMTWPVGWAPRVQKALESLPWAKHVHVDFDRKQATLRADPGQYDESAIVAVLDKAGFAGSKVVK